MKSLYNRAEVYKLMITNSFRQRYIYRTGVWIQILDGILFVFLQGSLWSALIRTGNYETTLKEMISFVVINSLVIYATDFNASAIISNRVEDGSIATDLILPVDFKWKLFFENFGEKIFDVIFSGMPGIIFALIFYGASAPAGLWQFGAFLLTVPLGILICYQIIYLFGLSAFWVVKPWYITFMISGLTKLFGGTVIPLWIYPDWLAQICSFLPFRFIIYEPIQIYLGNYNIHDFFKCVVMQVLWMLLLLVLEKAIWVKASRKVFVQGG